MLAWAQAELNAQRSAKMMPALLPNYVGQLPGIRERKEAITRERSLVVDVRQRRLRALLALWRRATAVAGMLACSHTRAVERVYAPGGAGFEMARDDFHSRAVRQRTQ